MRLSVKSSIILVAALYINCGFADDLSAIKASSINGQMIALADSKVPLSAIPKGSKVRVVIPNNAPISNSILDIWWEHREDLQNQKVIADYLATKPQIPDDFETAWKTARLVYFIGNYGYGEKSFVNTKAGAQLFNYGAEAGKKAMKLDPERVEGYYWYAIDLGSYGLAKGIIAAATNAKDGMRALEKAMVIDPTYQGYGSSRILGRYYQELPSFFGGNKEKALQLMVSATENAAEYKKNWVALGRYYISRGQYDKALTACNIALEKKAMDGKYEEVRYTREAEECTTKAREKLK